MFDKMKSLLKGTAKKSAVVAPAAADYQTASTGSVFTGYRTGSFDNNYPNINIIASTFSSVLPYAVDAKGERLAETPRAVTTLYAPNKEMSGVEFFYALATMSMVWPEVYILVHREENGQVLPGGNITADNIGGYTFLENASRKFNGKNWEYFADGKYYTDNEVICISLGVNPYNVNFGYSPSLSAKKWATTDDFIAEYQAGWFRNGAKPAGQFIITAATVEEYEEIAQEIKSKHQGIGKNNNVLFVHRPISALTGQPANAQIEWVPFNISNNDMALQSLFDQANKKLDMAFGVPSEIKGYISNSNYASAQVAESYFSKFVVAPKLQRIWSKFTSELNRITGGLGYAISYDFEIPGNSDEEKTQAETKQIQLATLQTAIAGGFSIESAVEALDLPEDFKKLALTSSPEPEISAEVVETVEELPTQAEEPKTAAKQASADPKDLDPRLARVVDKYLYGQIQLALGDLDWNDPDNEPFVNELLDLLTERMNLLGAVQFSEAEIMLIREGISTANLTSFKLSENALKEYREHLQNVANSFTSDTADSIRRVLERGAAEEWNSDQIARGLREIMDTDEWRVQRLARSESHRSAGVASLDAMQQVQAESSVKLAKKWHRNPSSNSCEDCIELDGKIVPIDEPFIAEGDRFPSDKLNDYENVESANAHPNCHCYLTYTIISAPAKSVDVRCPDCGRFLCKSKGGTIEGLKCQGCKKKLNIEIIDGEAKGGTC